MGVSFPFRMLAAQPDGLVDPAPQAQEFPEGGDPRPRAASATPMPALVDRILVKSGRRAFFVRAETIEWVEADGNYVHLHAGSQSHRVRATMSRFEIALDSARFVRIHKSAIVNLDRVHEFCPLDHGDVEVIMSDGTRLLMSRVYRERLAARGFRL